MTTDRLKAIRERDAGWPREDDAPPPAVADRRWLLAQLDEAKAQAAELHASALLIQQDRDDLRASIARKDEALAVADDLNHYLEKLLAVYRVGGRPGAILDKITKLKAARAALGPDEKERI